MKDIAINDLKTMLSWYESMVKAGVNPDQDSAELYEAVKREYEFRIEAESMDFNTCEGGACTL